MRAYLALFAQREVVRLVISAALTRIAAPVLSLGLLLAVNSSRDSYSAGGGVLSGYATTLAVAVPVAGRLVDRLQPRRVLIGYLTAHLFAYAALLLALARSAPLGVLIGCAAALGLTTPPAGPVVRSSWPGLVPKERLETAFALDAVVNEAMFVTGPLVVTGLLAFTSPNAAVAMAGCGTLAGVLLLLSVPLPARKPAPAGRRPLGPLAHGQVRVLLGIIVCDTLAYGGMVVAIAALASDRGSSGASGVLLSVLSAGAVISALIYGARERKGRPQRQLALYHAASAVLLVAVGQVSALALAGVLLLLVGLVGGPRDTLHQVVLGKAAPEEHRTEAFAWMSTFMWAGYGVGSALAGQLAGGDGGSAERVFLGAAVAAALASGVSLLVRPERFAATAAPATAGEAQAEAAEGSA
ncbi:MFS transporter [Streptomyces sp. NPDC052396]|uniref:MFS transporter n=1 Tax=Streptomyces sp. NPDC052396 TaxID=3365689 RepID=UPI0037CE2B67